MNSTRQISVRGPFRRGFLCFLLLLTVAVSSFSVQKYQEATAPDPSIVIRTDVKAVAAARQFLTATKWATDSYDLSQTSSITTDLLKGQKVWRVAWPSKTDSSPKRELSVLVFEGGHFDSTLLMDAAKGVYATAHLVAGEIKFVTRGGFVLEHQKP